MILHNKKYHKHVTSSTRNSIRTTVFLSSPPLLRYVDAAQEGGLSYRRGKGQVQQGRGLNSEAPPQSKCNPAIIVFLQRVLALVMQDIRTRKTLLKDWHWIHSEIVLKSLFLFFLQRVLALVM